MSEDSRKLFTAAKIGNAVVVKRLLEAGADPNTTDEYGGTLFYWALYYKRDEVVKILLEGGADPNLADEYNNSPVYHASHYDYLEGVKLLLEAGGNPNHENGEGWSPLYWPIFHGHVEMVKLLLERGADPNLENKHGRTPFSQARQRRRESRVLLETSTNSNLAEMVRRLENHKKVIDILSRVVPLRMLCLRIINNPINEVAVPSWLPLVLLEWPTMEEIIPQSNRKRNSGSNESIENKRKK